MATESGDFSDKYSKRTRKNGQRSINVTDHGGYAEMSYLPEEIVVNILSRLPVKSLLRFRCVCKSWLSLFSDRHFIETHLHMSNVDDNYSRHRLIVFGEDPNFSCKSWTLNSIYSDNDEKAVELDCPMKESLGNFYVVGSCDGLLCLCFQSNVIYLWNPCLKESRRLPPFDTDLWFDENDETEYPYSVFGFGYDCSIDDYVVIGMFCIIRDEEDYSDVEVNVYTLTTNSWRRLRGYPNDCAPFLINEGGNGVFVDGALHWISLDHKNSRVWNGDFDTRMNLKIIALDLAKETYHEIILPMYGYTDNLVLGVLEGCLCVLIKDSGVIDLWMMKEYGESWTKLGSFPYLKSLPDIGNLMYQTLLFLSRTSVLLWKFNSVLNLYNLKDNTFKSSVVNNFFTHLRDSAICVESLVSPKVVYSFT